MSCGSKLDAEHTKQDCSYFPLSYFALVVWVKEFIWLLWNSVQSFRVTFIVKSKLTKKKIIIMPKYDFMVEFERLQPDGIFLKSHPCFRSVFQPPCLPATASLTLGHLGMSMCGTPQVTAHHSKWQLEAQEWAPKWTTQTVEETPGDKEPRSLLLQYIRPCTWTHRHACVCVTRMHMFSQTVSSSLNQQWLRVQWADLLLQSKSPSA